MTTTIVLMIIAASLGFITGAFLNYVGVFSLFKWTIKQSISTVISLKRRAIRLYKKREKLQDLRPATIPMKSLNKVKHYNYATLKNKKLEVLHDDIIRANEPVEVSKVFEVVSDRIGGNASQNSSQAVKKGYRGNAGTKKVNKNTNRDENFVDPMIEAQVFEIQDRIMNQKN